MKNKRIFSALLCFVLLFIEILSFSGCSLNDYSVNELRTDYPKTIDNSLNEELYYWKETVNTSEYTSWRTCNVYAEIDKKYEIIRDEDGECANMKVEVFDEYNKKSVYKALCGKSSGENGEISYLFENDFDESGKAVNFRKTEITPQEYVAGDSFNGKYSLSEMLSEFKYLSVDDMNFDIDNATMEKRGKTIKFAFSVTDEYCERYKTVFGKLSIFEGSKYAVVEFAYDRFASVVVYAEEKLGGSIAADKEIYKLETVYYGPIVNIPSYDNDTW